jgi:hypothetical protein
VDTPSSAKTLYALLGDETFLPELGSHLVHCRFPYVAEHRYCSYRPIKSEEEGAGSVLVIDKHPGNFLGRHERIVGCGSRGIRDKALKRETWRTRIQGSASTWDF